MGSRTLQTWECDRCHTEDHGPDIPWATGWLTISTGQSNISSAPVLLCPTCAEALGAWWRTAEQFDGNVSS